MLAIPRRSDRRRSPRFLTATLPMLAALLTGGCTQIVISDAVSLENGHASYSSHYVLLRPVVLTPGAATSPVSARIEGIGLVGSGLAGSGITLGWRREQTILLGNAEDCRVVIFVDDTNAANAVTSALAACGHPAGAVCINKNTGRWRAE